MKLVHAFGPFYWLRPLPVFAIRVGSRKVAVALNVALVFGVLAVGAFLLKRFVV